jgi:hypothetical protein
MTWNVPPVPVPVPVPLPSPQVIPSSPWFPPVEVKPLLTCQLNFSIVESLGSQIRRESIKTMEAIIQSTKIGLTTVVWGGFHQGLK